MRKVNWVLCPDTQPTSSIVIPVYNQEPIIQKILTSLIENISLPSQLIIVVDKSQDFSGQRVLEFFKNFCEASSDNNELKIVSVDLVISSKSLYETKADNIGFNLAHGEFVIELQSDMLLNDRGFDAKLISCLRQNLDLFAVSGRAISSLSAVYNYEFQRRANPFLYAIKMLHQKIFNYSKDVPIQNNLEYIDRLFPSEKMFQASGLAGWRGGLIDDYSKNPNLIPTELQNQETRPIYIGEVIMRGPLCFRKSDLLILGYLDQDAFFLGYDEIDLSLRAWTLLGKRVAFMPVYLYSPAEWGSTRKPKSLSSRILLWSRFIAHCKWFRHSLAYKLISSPELRKQTSYNLKKEVRRTIPTK